jgi:DNA-binding response OmpR family regulator
MQNENRVLETDYIYEKVWGQPMAGDSQALGKAVPRLRTKLKGSGYTITSEYGNGYRFERGEP